MNYNIKCNKYQEKNKNKSKKLKIGFLKFLNFFKNLKNLVFKDQFFNPGANVVSGGTTSLTVDNSHSETFSPGIKENLQYETRSTKATSRCFLIDYGVGRGGVMQRGTKTASYRGSRKINT